MKLTGELRNLEGRKRLHKDARLKSACHEACHCLISLEVNQPFVRVEVGAQTLENARWYADTEPETVNIGGRVVVDETYQVYTKTAEAAAQVSLAGYVFERIVDPHSNGFVAMLSGAMTDMKQAFEWIRWWSENRGYELDEQAIEKYIDKVLIPPVRKHLIANWATVIRVGEALAQSGSLDFTQVRSLVAPATSVAAGGAQ